MSDGKKMDQGTRNLLELKLLADKVSAVFFPDRPKLLRSAIKLASTKMKMRAKALASGQHQAQQDGQNGQQLGRIKERFGNFKGFGLLRVEQEPQQPQSQEDAIAMDEQKKQLIEDAKRRQKDEEAKKKREEDAKQLKRARERMSISNL